MKNIKIITWLWNGDRGYRANHVHVLAKQFEKYLTLDYEFICIHSMRGQKFDENLVKPISMPKNAKHLGSYHTPEMNVNKKFRNFPSCYPRLWLFSQEAKDLFGGCRVLMIDIDTVLVGNIDHLFLKYQLEPFVGWKPYNAFGNNVDRLGGGMWLLDLGTTTEIYDDFKGEESIIEAREAGFRGSDQAWLSYKLYGKVPMLTEKDGIFKQKQIEEDFSLLNEAKLIHFNGAYNPWDYDSTHWLYTKTDYGNWFKTRT